MTPEVWNLVDIVVLAIVVGYCIAHYFTHADGDRLLTLWTAFVLSVVAYERTLMALGLLAPAQFTKFIRSWTILVYMLPSLYIYTEWKRNGKHADND